MKIIQTPAVINSIRSRVDHSIGFSCETPELSTAERAEFMELQGINVLMTIKPLDVEIKEMLEVKTEINEKTPGQRLRAVLFRHWEKYGKEKGIDKDVYYKMQMEKVIEQFKNQLD